MSIDISWDSLTTGPSGLELAESIRDFVHEKFQQVELPRFISSVHVHAFDFGKECPTVELKDVCDPLPEFYEDDESDDDKEGVEEEDVDGQEHGIELDLSHAHGNDEHSGLPRRSPRPTFIDTRLPHHRSGFSLTEHIATPFLSRSNTPGIPGGTSNLSYFHLPLSAGLSGTQTPLSTVTPFSPVWSDSHHHNRPPSPVRTHQPQHPYADPGSRPSTAHSGPHTQKQISPQPKDPNGHQGPSEDLGHPLDLQTTLHISYSGSLSISLTAEILLDYPMPSFVGIPLKLQITGLSFDGVAVLAYLHSRTKSTTSEATLKAGEGNEKDHGDETRGKVKFCFLGTEDARVMLGPDIVSTGTPNLNHGDSETSRASENINHAPKASEAHDDLPLGSLLRSIRVETEIGRQGEGKAVLKNVGKVEKFVLEQVRRIFEEEFVWPSFWTVLV